MSINGVTDNFSVQQSAAAINQVAAAELKAIDKKEVDKQADSQSYIKRILEAKSSENAGTQIVRDLVAKLASGPAQISPETFVGKAARSAKDEYEQLLQNKETSTDAVSIKTVQEKIKAVKNAGNGKDGQGKDNSDFYADVQKVTGTLEEFTSAYATLLVSGGNDIKKKVERLENELKSRGLSDREILGLKQNIRQTIRAGISSQIKDSVLKMMMSKKNSLEWIMNTKEAFSVIDCASKANDLGGNNFGGYNESLQGTVNKATQEASADIKDFITDELKVSLVRKHLNHSGADKEIEELVKLSSKANIDSTQFIKTWKVMVNDLGIIPIPPGAQAQSMIGSGMQDTNKQKTGYEYDKDEEKDLMVNQLRAAFMQRALKSDIKTQFEISFRIRKLKNGLIKLGVSFGEFENIEKEGRLIARAKTLEMLKEAFYERATLYELSGPAYKLNEQKIKGLVNNLEKLGMDLSKMELDLIRDRADFDMFDTTRNEFETSLVSYQKLLKGGMKSPGIEKKLMQMVKLMNRIKEEARIETDYKPEEKLSVFSSAN